MTAGSTDNIRCLHTSTKTRTYTCVHRPMSEHRQGGGYPRTSKPVKVPIRVSSALSVKKL